MYFCILVCVIQILMFICASDHLICYNGGTYEGHHGHHRCNCRSGYGGLHCENDCEYLRAFIQYQNECTFVHKE